MNISCKFKPIFLRQCSLTVVAVLAVAALHVLIGILIGGNDVFNCHLNFFFNNQYCLIQYMPKLILLQNIPVINSFYVSSK